MSRWLEDAGERHSFYRVAFISLASCTVFAVMVSMLLMDQKKIGLPGAAGILLIGWVTAAVITTLVCTTPRLTAPERVQTRVVITPAVTQPISRIPAAPGSPIFF